MSGANEPVGSLEVALEHASQLLAVDPSLAIEQAEEILKVVPGHTQAKSILATACYERGRALGAEGQGEAAVASLRRALGVAPDLADGWRLLGDHLSAMGDTSGAAAAYARHIKASTRDPRLLAPAAALCEGRLAVAETLLRAHLKQFPTDVAAIRMFAELAARLGRLADAESLLARCLELAPDFTAARHNYAVVLHRQAKSVDALREVDRLLGGDSQNPGYRSLQAASLARLGEYERAIATYAGLLADYPGQPKLWMSQGHALKTAGRRAESIEAYRRSIELEPSLGEAYWSLANLKTYRFTPAEIEAMATQLARSDLGAEDRLHFHFALGKAMEDTGNHAAAFANYAEGNRLRRATLAYDADETSALVRRAQALFTPDFFAARRGSGVPAPDPIFVVGLPRSGSTLVEQILASHPAVEGTMELPDLLGLVRELSGRKRRSQPSKYPDALAELGPEALRTLGERYLAQTRIQRKSDRPFFIDKMPNNWAHVGLIHLILPNARIVDTRRHPLSCCFSAFKQHFARGQGFTYSLEDVGRYYRDYAAMMAHFDSVLPGRVHRVIYEHMVADTETEIRRLLAHCGLEYDERCLHFYENDRAVRTASSEQVRSPIFRDAVDHWRHYEPWLGPLRQALGPALDGYPDTV